MAHTTTDTKEGANPADAAAPAGEFRWYMAGYGAYFFGMGVNGVVIPWLIAVELHESAERLGFAQMASMLPSLFLVLFGGLLADRTELRSHLMRLTFAASLPALGLMGIILAGGLSYTVVLCYGLLFGLFGAFIMPTRDALLTTVAERAAGTDIARAVGLATFVQFTAQLAGYALAGAADGLGPAALLACVSAAYVFSAMATQRLGPTRPKAAPIAQTASRPLAQELRAVGSELISGLKEAWHSPRIQPVVIQMFLGGIFGMGVFMVLLPILIRDEFGGGAPEIAWSLTSFFGGIATTALGLRFVRPIRQQGRMMMLASLGGAVVLMAIYVVPHLWLLFVCTYIWGLSAGLNMTMSRTIVQQSATPSHRARIMSVFSLSFMGGGPIGALAIGYLISEFGPRDAILIPAVGIGSVFIGMLIFTRLWQIESLEPRPA